MTAYRPWSPPGHTGSPDPVTVTDRRLLVLDGVCRGLSNQQIAHELFLTVDTVKNHVRRLLSDLGATSRTHAVALLYSGAVQVQQVAHQWERAA